MTTRTMFFVTGAPRSGTTFVSDWITETPGAYCVHEIRRELTGRSTAEITDYLLDCARSGYDRTSKTLLREYMNWAQPLVEPDPQWLGLKEPVTWPVCETNLPMEIQNFIEIDDVRSIILIRHPFDVVASGLRRARDTKNWSVTSVEQHCRYWLFSLSLLQQLRERGTHVICIKWESLMLGIQVQQRFLEDLLQIELPDFSGYERSDLELRAMTKNVCYEKGLHRGPHRDLLTPAQQSEIKSLVAKECEQIGYKL